VSRDEAWRLRTALELLCRKVNPPHRWQATLLDLMELGWDGADLSSVPLAGAYLRGLSVGSAALADDPHQLDAAILEDGDWSLAERLAVQVLRRTVLLTLRWPEGVSAPAIALADLGDRGVRPWCPLGGEISDLAVLPDGRWVTAGAALIVWDPQAERPLHVLEGHRGLVLSVSSLGEGRVLSGGSDGTVRVWELSGSGEGRVLEGHRGSVWSVSSLGEGRVLSGGDDGTRYWNLQTGRCERWVVAVAPNVVWRADRERITITHLAREWRTVQRDGRRLPEDPLLHRWSSYVVDGSWALPVRHFPDLIEIDEENPRRFVQHYPEKWRKDPAKIQAFLCQERKTPED